MNRQALAFLTMFSLILMLSVYYVTLPSDATSVMSTENGEELSQGEQDTSEEVEQTSNVEKLQKEINAKQEEEVKKNSDIVSSNEASDEQKKEALATMDSLKSEQALMEEITSALVSANFMSAVEIVDGTCMVSVFDSEDTTSNAQTIMQIVSEKCNDKYLIEVSFK